VTDRLLLEALAGYLPQRWAAPLGAAAGDLAWRADRVRKRRIEARLTAALPGLTAPHRRRLARATSRRRGALRFLSRRLLALDDVRFCRHLELVDWRHFHAAEELQDAVFAATAPLGSPAIVARALALYRPGTPLLTATAASEGPDLLATDGLLDGLSGAGRPVRLVAAIALAGRARFRIEILEAERIDPGGGGAAYALGRWREAVEAVIRRHPAQFDWGAGW